MKLKINVKQNYFDTVVRFYYIISLIVALVFFLGFTNFTDSGAIGVPYIITRLPEMLKTAKDCPVNGYKDFSVFIFAIIFCLLAVLSLILLIAGLVGPAKLGKAKKAQASEQERAKFVIRENSISGFSYIIGLLGMYVARIVGGNVGGKAFAFSGYNAFEVALIVLPLIINLICNCMINSGGVNSKSEKAGIAAKYIVLCVFFVFAWEGILNFCRLIPMSEILYALNDENPFASGLLLLNNFVCIVAVVLFLAGVQQIIGNNHVWRCPDIKSKLFFIIDCIILVLLGVANGIAIVDANDLITENVFSFVKLLIPAILVGCCIFVSLLNFAVKDSEGKKIKITSENHVETILNVYYPEIPIEE